MRSPRFATSLLLCPLVALATTLVPHGLKQRAQHADRVALVQVLSQRVEDAPSTVAGLKTFTRVVVGQDLKGTGPAALTIVQLGGDRGLNSAHIPGDAHFAVGERAVVFLRCRLAPDRCHLVALGAGKLEVEGDRVRSVDLQTGATSMLSLSELSREVK